MNERGEHEMMVDLIRVVGIGKTIIVRERSVWRGCCRWRQMFR